MKKLHAVGLGFVLAGCGFASSASAALLVQEPFTYADGGLVGNTPATGGTWNAQSAAGQTPILVSGDTISLNQGSGSREDDNVPFAGGFAAGAGDVVYSTFDLTVPDPGAAVTTTYFAAFIAGTSNYTSRLFVTAPAGTSGYRLALSNGSSSLSAASAYSDDLAFGTTYSVSTTYDYSTATGSLYIGATDFSTAGIGATDSGFSDAVDAYAFRQAAGNTVETIDNLTVGTLVPEPACLSLIGIGAMGLLARRRRA